MSCPEIIPTSIDCEGKPIKSADMSKKEELPEWKRNILDKMKANHEKRFNELKEEYNQRLHDLISMYFQMFSLDEEENKNNFDILNEDWKTLVNKVKATRSIISLKHEAFENAIKENMEHPEFKKAVEKMKADAEKAQSNNIEEPVNEKTEIQEVPESIENGQSAEA